MLKKAISKLNPNVFFIVKAGGISFIARLAASILGFITSIIIARFYGASIMGAVSIVLALTSFLALFGLIGGNVTLIKLCPNEVDKGFDLYKKIFKSTLIISITVSITLFFLRSKVTALTEVVTNDVQLLIIFCIFIFSLFNLSVNYLRATNDIFAYAVATFCQSLFRLGCILFAIFLIDNELFPVYLVFIVPSVSLILLVIYIYKSRPIKTLKTSVSYKSFYKAGFLVMIPESVYLIIANIDILMITEFLGVKDAGIYSTAIGLIIILNMIVVSFQSFSAPKFSEFFSKQDFDELNAIAQQLTKINFLVIFFPCLFFLLFSKDIISVVYGEDFTSGWIVVSLMSGVYLFKSLFGLSNLFLNMSGNEKVNFYTSIVACMLNIWLNYTLIPHFGMAGAAVSTGIALLVWSLLSTIYLYFRYELLFVYIPFLRKIK